MVDKNINLSHWTEKEDKKQFANRAICKYIQNYHLLQLRFIYTRFKNKFKGAILNCDLDMICPISVAAFLSTISNLPDPVLILTSEQNFSAWRHFLNMIPQANLLLNGSKLETELKNTTLNLVIILGTTKELFQMHDKYSIVVIDNIDSVITARAKRGDFNIGITYKNFYKYPDDKLLWTILNWSNLNFVGNYNKFEDKYKEFLDNRIEPYQSIFLRITWNFCDSFNKENLKDVKKEIDDNRDFFKSEDDIVSPKKRKREEKLPAPKKNIKKLSKSTRNNGESVESKYEALKNISTTTNTSFDTSDINENGDTFSQIIIFNENVNDSNLTRMSETKNTDFKSITTKTGNISLQNNIFLQNIDDSISTNVKDVNKQDVTSPLDDSYIIIDKIVDSPVKDCIVDNDMMDSDSSFEDSEIFSQIIAKYKKENKYSVMESIIDAKLSKVHEIVNFSVDSGDSDGESVLSKLFP